jgi:hypothetical protein
MFDDARLLRAADWLAVATAMSLPWSTSVTSILVVAWLFALIPALDRDEVRDVLLTPAGGLPVLLVVIGALGMLWADVSLFERWHGFEAFLKLLVIPLLFVQFRRSDRGLWVFGGYVASCAALLTGALLADVPGLSFIPLQWDHVLVKNEATQSGEFVTCIFGLLFLTVGAIERRRWAWLIVLLAVILGMAADMLYIATGRTALAVAPLLLVIFAFRRLSAKGAVIFLAGAIVLVAAAWFSSPHLRSRITQIWTDFAKYEATDERNSSGERIEFTKKSITFIRDAPIVGHGTGSIPGLFARSAIGQAGAAASATTNPHNQTFAVAIQVGLLGAAVLWAMWIAHLLLFRGDSLAGWVGLVIVVQNVVGSLFNSHLFDFVQGWVYVIGVGVAGGMVLKRRMTDLATGPRLP